MNTDKKLKDAVDALKDVGDDLQTSDEEQPTEEQTPADGKKHLRLVEISEILNKEYEPLWFPIEKFLCGGSTLIYGPPKSGKSFLCAQMAGCLVRGAPFMGMKTEKCPVIYCGLEDYEARFQRRYSGMFPDVIDEFETRSGREPLYTFTDVPSDDFMEELENDIMTFNGHVVVFIDVLQKVKGSASGKLNAYQADYMTMSPFQDLAKRTGCAIVLIHHDNKDGRINGSHGIDGSVDQIIKVDRAEQSEDAELTFTGREFTREPLSIRQVRSRGGLWILNGIIEPKPTKEMQERQKYDREPFVIVISELFEKSNGRLEVTYKDLLDRIEKRFPDRYAGTRDLSAKIRNRIDQMRDFGKMNVEPAPQVFSLLEDGTRQKDRGIIVTRSFT